MWNLCSGSCGTVDRSIAEIVRIRTGEARNSARLAGATFHPPLVEDIKLYYEPRVLHRIAATVREIKPTIFLLQSPQDYMEDHQNACRLMVTAAFCRGMRNFITRPNHPPYGDEVAVYHAQPYGLRDALRRLIVPGHYVDVSSVLQAKRDLLACHKSQKEWLDASQGMDSYLNQMVEFCRQVGKQSGRFKFAEGWRQHSHLGFGAENFDPLKKLLGTKCRLNPKYQKELGQI
jgi:LmbE family N-acetylglucosaminyl deacetylase